MRNDFRNKSIGQRREFLASPLGVEKLVLGLTLDYSKFGYEDSHKECRVPYGAVLGKITASGKFRLCTVGALGADATATDTTIEIADRRNFSDEIQPIPFVAGDSIVIGFGTADVETKTIDSIDYETRIVTLTAPLSNDHSEDDIVKCSDGSEDAVTILDEEADVTEDDYIAGGFRKAHIREDLLPYELTTAEKTLLVANTGITFMA